MTILYFYLATIIIWFILNFSSILVYSYKNGQSGGALLGAIIVLAVSCIPIFRVSYLLAILKKYNDIG